MATSEEKDQPYSIQTIIKLLRGFTERGNLQGSRLKTLENLIKAIESLNKEQRSDISIEGIDLNDFYDAIITELQVRGERKTKGIKQEITARGERLQRDRVEAWGKLVDTLYGREEPRVKWLIGETAEKKVRNAVKNVVKGIGVALIRPVEVAKTIQIELSGIINAHLSDAVRLFASWINKKYRKINKKDAAQIITRRFKTTEEGKKIIREAYKHFLNATGITVKKYLGVSL